MGSELDGTPLLTIAVPTYRRPELLRRALASIVETVPEPDVVEVVISDNSPEVSAPEVERFRGAWSGRLRYVPNDPTIEAIANWNQCVTSASGRWLLFLHDDDYLLPGGGAGLLRALRRATEIDRVLLFGVHVVTLTGRVRRRQLHRREQRLGPREALRRLLTNSSLIRVPGLAVRRDALAAVGLFDPAVGAPADFDHETRLIGQYGLLLEPEVIAAYTVHQAATTAGMFHARTIRDLLPIFDRAAAAGVLSLRDVRGCERTWMHQFILGGAYRSLRGGDRARVRDILRLFELPEVRALGVSWRWLPVRIAFTLIAMLPVRPAAQGAEGR